MSEQEPSLQASEPESDVTCDNCLDGIVFPLGECPECGPTRAIRDADPKIARRLASKDWRALVEKARRYLLFDDARESLKLYLSCMQIVILDPLITDANAGAPIQFQQEYDKSFSTAQLVLVRTARVAHALAAWLGTSSVAPVTMSLVTGLPLSAEHLASGQRGTAADAYVAAIAGLSGLRIPGGTYQAAIAATLVAFRKSAKEAGLGWEETRVAWDRNSPGWRFESKDAMRKAVERARRPRNK